jgi:hypothetical protein
MNKQTVVGLIGTPFSGSTVAQTLLAMSSNTFAAGELDRLRGFKCYEHLAHEVDEHLYQDGCLICEGLGRRCVVWTAETLSIVIEGGIEPDLYRTLSKLTNKSVVIDATKTPYWYLRMLSSNEMDGVKLFLVHCVSHPFRYALSLQSRRPGWPLPHCVFDWMIVTIDILQLVNLFSHKIEHTFVLRFEDVAADGDVALAAIKRRASIKPLDHLPGCNWHPIGGNKGATEELIKFKAENPNRRSSPLVVRPPLDFRSLIDEGELERLARIPGLYTLASQFGYRL